MNENARILSAFSRFSNALKILAFSFIHSYSETMTTAALRQCWFSRLWRDLSVAIGIPARLPQMTWLLSLIENGTSLVE